MGKTFLTAEWRKLVMANYAIDEAILKPYLPYKTELDLWNNTYYVSLVGFMFQNTKLKGLRLPFHSNFEEVNLRFYVRYKEDNDWKRGVVFIKEIVPKYAITLVANAIYREHYETRRMKHTWLTDDSGLKVEYAWKHKDWQSFSVNTAKTPKSIDIGSEEEFITEHYWGYTKFDKNHTSEYGVEHPRWEVYETQSYEINVDFEEVYGKSFGFLNNKTPLSVFLAEGSEIRVLNKNTLIN